VPAGVVTPGITASGEDAAGDYAVTLGLGMAHLGEVWAVADKELTLGGTTLTTDDAGEAQFDLGSASSLAALGLSPSLELGDGRYVLTVQLHKDGENYGRTFAAPLLVGSAAAAGPGDPGSGSGGSGSDGSGSEDSDSGSGDSGSGDSGSDGSDSGSDSGDSDSGDSGSGDSGSGDSGSGDSGSGNSGSGDSGSGDSGSGSDGSDSDSGDSGSGDSDGPGVDDSDGPSAGDSGPDPGDPGESGDLGSGSDGSDGSDSGSGPDSPDAPDVPEVPEVPEDGSGPDDGGIITYPSVGPFSITSISPTRVNVAGGTLVTITGTDLPTAPQVRIGDSAAAFVVSSSATEVVFRAPARVAGAYDVHVFAPDGRTSVLTAALTYSADVGGPGSGGADDGSDDSGSGGDPDDGTGGSDGSGGSGGSDDGTDDSDGSAGPVTTTGPGGERLVRTTKFASLGSSFWSMNCSVSCTGVAL
jgi:hypothetical protein